MIKGTHVYLSHGQHGRFFAQAVLQLYARLVFFALAELVPPYAPVEVIRALALKKKKC